MQPTEYCQEIHVQAVVRARQLLPRQTALATLYKGGATYLLAGDGAIWRSRGVKVLQDTLESRETAAWQHRSSCRIGRPDSRDDLLSGGGITSVGGSLS